MTDKTTFPDLRGKSVFITGGGSGIGAALSEAFLAQGAKVAFVGRSDYSEFCDILGERYGEKPLFIQCDITDTSALNGLTCSLAREFGPDNIRGQAEHQSPLNLT